ncbi:MAG: hypothetical protein VKK59_06860 [Vampirovibrionales bacterium]|nr:hypothetical protein [Vampirovibrionales bacterium]
MVGLIWFVQVVHYPLYHQVGISSFALYEAMHTHKTTLVVAAPMLLEVFSAIALLYCRPQWMSAQHAFWGVMLVGIIWIITAFFSVPDHGKLSAGYDGQIVNHLVAWNWLRTIAWTLRGLGLAALVIRLSYVSP